MKDLEKTRVLVVDDEEDLCWAFEMAFEDSEFQVETSASGESAVDRMKGGNYPVVILDSKLPGIDGFETARRLRKVHPNTSIALFSGYHNSDDKEIKEGLSSGLLDGFISKPFDFDEVKDFIISHT